MLLTTHYMDEAERLCDRLAIVDHGVVIAEGTPSELIERLGGHHVVEFEASGNSGAGAALDAWRALYPAWNRSAMTIVWSASRCGSHT